MTPDPPVLTAAQAMALLLDRPDHGQINASPYVGVLLSVEERDAVIEALRAQAPTADLVWLTREELRDHQQATLVLADIRDTAESDRYGILGEYCHRVLKATSPPVEPPR